MRERSELRLGTLGLLMCLVPLLLGWLPARLAHAADATVNLCTEAALLGAIETTAGDGTVTFACGGPAVITLTQTITVPNGARLELRGERLITISGGDAVRPFQVNQGGTLTLDGLTVSGGRASDGGGAHNQGALILVDTLLTGNRATNYGGAIYSIGQLTITGGAFTNNSAQNDGGALANSPAGTLTLSDVRFEGNSAGGRGGAISSSGALDATRALVRSNSATTGGGLAVSADLATLRDSEVSGNSATGDGGGVRNERSLTLAGTTVAENSAANGGGIDSDFQLTLRNSTVSGNRAATTGGGIVIRGTLALTATTVTANEAGASAGGLFRSAGSATLRSTILAGNSAPTGPDCLNGLSSNGGNLVQQSGGCTFAPQPGDLAGVDPQLGPLADNGGPSRTHALAPTSPAVDVLGPALCEPQDQRGVSRPIAQTPETVLCDIGAFELGFVVNSLADVPDENLSFSACSTSARVCTLRAAIQQANSTPGKQSITFAVSGIFALTANPVNPDFEPDGGGDLDIAQSQGLILLGLGRTQTVIDGGSDPLVGGVLEIASGADVTISGVTIRGGNAGGAQGGGIRNAGTLTLRDSTVTGNSAGRGAGIANTGALTLERVTVSSNTAELGGGGIDSRPGGAGGVGRLTIRDSTVSGNAATGALAEGGGISNGGAAALLNVTVSDNSATGNGGGIAVTGGGNEALLLNNVTVAGNVADADGNANGDGGGIFVQELSGDVTLMNTLIATNTDGSTSGATVAPDCSGNLKSLGYNLIGIAARCNALQEQGDRYGTITVPLDPRLSPLRANGGATQTRAAQSGSPAIDGGSPAAPGGQGNACVSTDQRGVARPIGARCDIGASEALLADLQVQQTSGADPLIERELMLTTTVVNSGPEATEGVVLTIVRPAQTVLVATSASQGSCNAQGAQIICSLGALAGGATATVDLVVRPLAGGGASASATVTATEADPNLANNSGGIQLRVGWPLYIPVVRR
jgi:CSLREA domain-containing protein